MNASVQQKLRTGLQQKGYPSGEDLGGSCAGDKWWKEVDTGEGQKEVEECFVHQTLPLTVL